MSTRRLATCIVLAALVLGGALIAQAADIGGGKGRLNRQSFKWTTTPASTDSAEFSDVPGLRDLLLCGSGPISANVSLQLEGDAEIRVVAEQQGSESTILRPGPVPFASGTGSFTFVHQRRGAYDLEFDVEWRSVTGRPVTISKGSMEMLWASNPSGGECSSAS
jgi:hypothetical protein